MNYLSHIYLSQNDEEIILGNVLGDFTKNKEVFTNYPKIYNGISVHQKLDFFTDTHEIFLKSKRRISKKNSRCAGVFIDIFYDHFLALNWIEFSNSTLHNFVKRFYKILDKYENILPEKLTLIKSKMINENWLLMYKEKDCILNALKRIEKRLNNLYNSHEIMLEFDKLYVELESDFRVFFKEMIEYVKREIYIDGILFGEVDIKDTLILGG